MNLNFKTYGSGEPVIILHGLFGMLDNWQRIAKDLAEDFLVYIIDQRNHGKSPKVDSHSYEEMAEDLVQFMENNWIYEAAIVGHSMGGKTAMQFTMSYPDFVDKLVVVDMPPTKSERGHDEIFNALMGLNVGKIQNRKEAEALLEIKIPNFAVRQFLLKNLTRRKEGGYRWKMNLPVLHREYDKILEEIRPLEVFEGPTLFLKGENSSYIKEEDKLLMEKLFPKHNTVEVKGAGHWIHADKPVEFSEILSGFLKGK